MNLTKIYDTAEPAHTLEQVDGGFQVNCIIDAQKPVPVAQVMPLKEACKALVHFELESRTHCDLQHMMMYQIGSERLSNEYRSHEEASIAFDAIVGLHLLGVYKLEHIFIIETDEDENGETSTREMFDSLKGMAQLFKQACADYPDHTDAIVDLSNRSIEAAQEFFTEMLEDIVTSTQEEQAQQHKYS